MPIFDVLIDAVAWHRVLSSMDGHFGCNLNFIAEEDMHKMAFQCLGSF